jgi:carbonic anhydrase/acetyltransferase-like protein (isoleucine patch superfamily)
MNTAVGHTSNVLSNNLTNTTMVGFSARGTASNQVRIGNNSVTSIGGFANWSNISDGRVKKNIKQNVPGLAFINKLKPITYNLDLDVSDKIIQNTPENNKIRSEGTPQPALAARQAKQQIVYTGFIAQDVEKAAKELNYDFSGVDAPKNEKDLYALRYAEFVVPLVKAVQELSKLNDEKDARIDDLQKQINELKAMVHGNITSTAVDQQSTASLEQNVLRPFK